MKKENNMKKILNIILSILASTIFALLFHKLLPQDANAANANSFLVEKLSFPVVAIIYFLVLFCSCTIAIYFLGSKSCLTRKEIFLRFGISYGLIYFVGMFEIVPGYYWDITVGIKQFFVGIGDAIPAFLIAYLISRQLPPNKKTFTSIRNKQKLQLIISISSITLALRLIGNKTLI